MSQSSVDLDLATRMRKLMPVSMRVRRRRAARKERAHARQEAANKGLFDGVPTIVR